MVLFPFSLGRNTAFNGVNPFASLTRGTEYTEGVVLFEIRTHARHPPDIASSVEAGGPARSCLAWQAGWPQPNAARAPPAPDFP